jgi:glutaredoxin 3
MAGKTKAKKATPKKSPESLAGKKAKTPAPNVIVYTSDDCIYCHRAMDFLKENNIVFQARNVDNPKFAKEAFDKSDQYGVPVIVVAKDVVIGFDEGRLKTLLRIK